MAAKNDPKMLADRTLGKRRVAQMVCLRCAPARAALAPLSGSDRRDGGTDQAAVQHTTGAMTLYACKKCKTWNWEFRGDFRGMLVQREDESRIERLFRRADPAMVRKTPVFRMLCELLDGGRVRAADGSMSEQFCAACENAPHPDGRCDCPCHAAWDYRRTVEAEEAA